MSSRQAEGAAKSAVKLNNPYLSEDEYLYHLGIGTKDEIVSRFGDVKFICVGGKRSRMRNFAEKMYDVLGKPENSELDQTADAQASTDQRLKNLSAHAGRYSLFKVGPVACASHGIGSASTSVLLHELLKLAHYAGCTGLSMIRIGTSGGLGLDPGTVVITKQAYNGLLEPHFRQVSCGKECKYSTKTDSDLNQKLSACAQNLKIKAEIGNTMAADDFYEEQARLDGAFCNFTSDEKKQFLQRAFDEHGIMNIEMESACFVAMCNRANVKCAVVCVSVINRLLGDEITSEVSLIKNWEQQPQDIVAQFINDYVCA